MIGKNRSIIVQALMSLLMAGLLLIQAITGWCCVPLRAMTVEKCSSVSASIPPVCCCHQRQLPAGQSDEQPAPRDGKTTCHGFCIYVPHENFSDAAHGALIVSFFAIIPASVDAPVVTTLAQDCCWKLAVDEPPLRLHLLHQVLVI
jgi:hypothetical protein